MTHIRSAASATTSRNAGAVQEETTQALLSVAGASDANAQGHSERVRDLCMDIGEAMGLGPSALADLRYAASLHDIGKIGVSKSIVNKIGRLSDEEFSAMKLHSVIGIRILERIEGLQGALPMIKHHHECWNGRGYPDGLAGDDIPLGARIISVAETFDILTSTVPWREPMTLGDAVQEIRRCSGTQFDPEVVEAFLKVVKKLDTTAEALVEALPEASLQTREEAA
ncbi:MAG: HD-GYP domain-containing protein [Armatimonadetes bacterium]|nr:HD-GYP domain-containing protein [Armatimonadota bacterium]